MMLFCATWLQNYLLVIRGDIFVTNWNSGRLSTGPLRSNKALQRFNSYEFEIAEDF